MLYAKIVKFYTIHKYYCILFSAIKYINPYNKSKETEHISIMINRNLSSDFIRITCCLQTDLFLVLSKM